MRKSRKFGDTFKKIGKERELTDELFSHLEEFICTLYGYEEKDVNKVRWLKFRDKHTKQNKVIEMAALPPCKKNSQITECMSKLSCKNVEIVFAEQY